MCLYLAGLKKFCIVFRHSGWVVDILYQEISKIRGLSTLHLLPALHNADKYW
jgi:hypothetical protein